MSTKKVRSMLSHASARRFRHASEALQRMDTKKLRNVCPHASDMLQTCFRGAAADAEACEHWKAAKWPCTCFSQALHTSFRGAAACLKHALKHVVTRFSSELQLFFFYFCLFLLLIPLLKCPYKDINKPNTKCNRTFTINTRELTTFLDNMCLQILSYN